MSQPGRAVERGRHRQRHGQRHRTAEAGEPADHAGTVADAAQPLLRAAVGQADQVDGVVLEAKRAAMSTAETAPTAIRARVRLALARLRAAAWSSSPTRTSSRAPLSRNVASGQDARKAGAAGQQSAAAPASIGYSARSADAVRVRAAQPAGARAPVTAMASPPSASSTSSHGR